MDRYGIRFVILVIYYILLGTLFSRLIKKIYSNQSVLQNGQSTVQKSHSFGTGRANCVLVSHGLAWYLEPHVRIGVTDG